MAEALGNRKKTFETSACKIAKVEVAGPNPVSRSKEFKGLANKLTPFSMSFSPDCAVIVQ
jgi:hypothetical protein